MTSPDTKWDPAYVSPPITGTLHSAFVMSMRKDAETSQGHLLHSVTWPWGLWTQEPPCLARNSIRSWTSPEPSGWDEQPCPPCTPTSLAELQNTCVPSDQGADPHLVPTPLCCAFSRSHQTRGLILTLPPHHCAVPCPSASQEQLQPPPRVLTLAVGSHISLLRPPHSLFSLGLGKNT